MSQQQAEMNQELHQRYFEIYDRAVASPNFSEDDLALIARAFGIAVPKDQFGQHIYIKQEN